MNASELKRTTGRLAPLVAATTLFLAPALSAQDPPEPLGAPAEPGRECVCAWGESPRVFRSFMGGHRARIGVVLGEPADVGARRGIRLEDVVESGPASEAGLRTGDILLALNGNDLGEDPTRRLLELLRDVEPGDTVTVAYSRDGADRAARIITSETAGAFSLDRGNAPAIGRIEHLAPLRGTMVAPRASINFRQMLGDGLDLVAMNEQLGEYFDVAEGVLVTAVEDNSTLGLRSGDVILSIGGREVRDPAHARSILGSYRGDESVTFEIVRDGRRTSVSGTRFGR